MYMPDLLAFGAERVVLRHMGVPLTPIISKGSLDLADLRGRTLAVDGNAELYQFLALLRQRDGTPLHDSRGRITSHLSGLFFRVTRLMSDHGVQLAFVFDGTPPALKAREVARRRATRARYEDERAAALERGDTAAAYSKSTMTARLTREMVAEAMELLRLLGVPTVQAPSEGEAQAAHMAATSSRVWAAATKDYDDLLFGAPRVVRFLGIAGKEFLPSQAGSGRSCQRGSTSRRCSPRSGSTARASSILRCSLAPTSTTASKASDRRRH